MNQKTIRYPVSIQGVGLHSGDTCTVKLSPSSSNKGVRFFLNSDSRKCIFPSDANRIINPVCSTNIGDELGMISTIEHLMACLHVMGIDNIDITVTGGELPILDGSGKYWWGLLKGAGIQEIKEEKVFNVISEPYEFSNGSSHIYCEPCDTLDIHMKIDFDHPRIGKQETHFMMYDWYDWEEEFERAFVWARTFGFWKDIKIARDNGMLKGGSMLNAIVLDDKDILNPPLRTEDEFVTHKMLDFIGDIYVNGPILGFFDVCCTSHQFNNQTIRQIIQTLS